jgi:uncharacterized protein (DUF302 family)
MVNYLVDILKKELNMEFDEAINHVQEIIKEQGFSVLITKALDEIFKAKLDVIDYPRFTFIVACNPKLAKMALDVSFNVGSIFPCSFVVYEDEGKVIVSHLSIMKSAVELGLASAEDMKSVIKTTSEIVHAAWDRF